MFRKHILQQLRKWRDKEDRAVLMMDANEHMIDGVMCRQPRNNDIGMIEFAHCMEGSKDPKHTLRDNLLLTTSWYLKR